MFLEENGRRRLDTEEGGVHVSTKIGWSDATTSQGRSEVPRSQRSQAVIYPRAFRGSEALC
jgi:hypothetical protein